MFPGFVPKKCAVCLDPLTESEKNAIVKTVQKTKKREWHETLEINIDLNESEVQLPKGCVIKNPKGKTFKKNKK